VQFEERGVPAVALVGGPFMPMAKARALSLEYPDARIVVFEHPINSVDEAAVRARGDRIVDEVIEAFLR
jgi:hypothetical protein